nr:endonuclease V [candidate division Zixibacteria bacterium]
MKFQPLHEWPSTPGEAVKIQQQFKSSIILENVLDKIETIAAVDTAYNVVNNRLYAAVVTLKYPDLNDVERAVAEMEAQFPYIPALLAFREGPVILKAISRLKRKPDVIIYAGHGIAHPRSFGMASHIGLFTDIPSIGCARKVLVGEHRMPGRVKGSCSPLSFQDSTVGFVYRTKGEVKPMIISPGHKCDLKNALEIVVNCLSDFRMPEPLRQAHLFASKFKQSSAKKFHQGGVVSN